MMHIGQIIARMTEEVARRQAKWLDHTHTCGYWRDLKPLDCTCETRPVIDLLLHIAERKAA